MPDGSIDAVISNCVITLSTDTGAVFAEIARVLRAGGRVGISDLIADDDVTDADRAAAKAAQDPLAYSLTTSAYAAALCGVGLTDVVVLPTHAAGPKTRAASFGRPSLTAADPPARSLARGSRPGHTGQSSQLAGRAAPDNGEVAPTPRRRASRGFAGA